MNLGLEELTARDADHFIDIARTLAADPARQAGLRATLRQRMRQSPLMNHRQFARDMESAYRQMWQQCCKSNL
jgi:predicted O-linked N-acetylglucosamine transferase (SPINDLY family)